VLSVDVDEANLEESWPNVERRSWSGALLSCCAPFTTRGWRVGRSRQFGYVEQVTAWAPGWGWLVADADRQGRLGWQKRQRLGAAIDRLAEAHPGERALWLRFSAPSRPHLMLALNRWMRHRRDLGLVLDAVRVIDQGTNGEHVWHVHILGFGTAVDLEVEAAVIQRAGGYGFIHAEWVDVVSKRGYLLRRLRGYIGAKESGWRRLRVGGPGPTRRAAPDEAALADRSGLSSLRARFTNSGESADRGTFRGVLGMGKRGQRVQLLAESLAARAGGGVRGAEFWRSRDG
jgi:hypothetical protein